MEIKYQAKHPVQFTKRLLRNIGKISNKTIIVIRDWWTAVELAKNNRVLFITDSPDARDLFEQVVYRNRAFGNDDEVLFINNWQMDLLFSVESNGKKKKQKRKTWKEILSKCEMKDWPMKFDYCIQNPPYDRNLHLKVLEQTLKVADKVINISPIRWLQDPFAPYSSKSDYCKFEDSISKKIESLDVIPAKDAIKLFDAAFTMNLGIYVCSDKGGYAYQHNDSLVTKIVKRTMTNNWTQYAYTKQCRIPQKEYILKIGSFGGSAQTDLALLTNTSYESQLTTKEPNTNAHNACNYTMISFNTEAERRNFYNCYNHPFMKWHTRLWKVDVGIRTSNVPYFDDYTHPWTFKDFFNWFDLTKAEQSRVIREIRQIRYEKRH